MAQVIIPTAHAETPVEDSGGDTPFPKGQWQSTILKVDVQDFPEWAGEEDSGYANAKGKILNIHFAPNSPLEGQDDVGGRRHFVPIVIKDGDETSVTVDVASKGPNKKLRQSTSLLTNLGIALGETEQLEDENGKAMTALAEDFEENLKAGAFDGVAVGFKITHFPWVFNGKSGTKAITKEFFQAV